MIRLYLTLQYIIIIIIIIIIGLVGRVFANGPGDLGSISGSVIPKTLKMVLDTALLNTQQYKVRIKGKVEQSRERISALPLHLGVVTIEKGALWSSSITVANFTLLSEFLTSRVTGGFQVSSLFQSILILYIDPRPSRQSRDVPVEISRRTAEASVC